MGHARRGRAWTRVRLLLQSIIIILGEGANEQGATSQKAFRTLLEGANTVPRRVLKTRATEPVNKYLYYTIVGRVEHSAEGKSR